MELRGISPEGDAVKASLSDLAEGQKKSLEAVQFGSTPTHVVYRNMATNQTREVDLQEVAQAAGIRNVQFHFDPDQAKEQGLLVDRDIDKGVAYNLERIKTDELRSKYLADVGFKNVVKHGDDYYSYENGKMFPINNKDGLDASDAVRIIAHAGRDIGSAIGATAAVGGGAVAALPSGGTSLLAGAAAAGLAGAAGGVIGEGGQRMLDKAFGAPAAKYNAQMTGTEEGAAFGQDALVAGLGGAAQPLMVAGGAKLAENVVAPAIQKLGGEWGAMQAAKMEAGAAMTRLPQGYMQKFASEEQMSAQAALRDGLNLAQNKALSAEEMGQVTQEAGQMLKPGAVKPAAEMSEEAGAQQQLRQQFQSKTVEMVKNRQVEQAFAAETAKAEKMRADELVATQTENVRKFFGQAGFKKEVETVFDPKADIDAATAAQQKIIGQQVGKFARNLGLSLDKEPVTEKVIGIEAGSLKGFVNDQREMIYSTAKEQLSGQRSSAAFLDQPPPDFIKGTVVKQINSVLNSVDAGALKGELKQGARDILTAIDEHVTGSNEKIRGAIDAFHQMAIDVADQSSISGKTHEALDVILDATKQYEVGATGARDVVQGYYAGFNKLMEAKTVQRLTRGSSNTPELMENMVRGLDQVARATGDHEGSLIKPLVNAVHLDQILTGEANTAQPFREMLEPATRERFDALHFLKEMDAGAGKERIATGSKDAKKIGAAVASGLLAKVSGGSFIEGAAFGYATGGMLPNKVATAGKLLGAAASKVKGVASDALEATGSAALSAYRKVPGTTAAKAGFTGNVAVEETEEEQLRKLKRKT